MKRVVEALMFVTAAAGLLAFGSAAFAQKGEMIVDITAPPLVHMPRLNEREAAERYTQGTLHERKRELRAAFIAYSESGESGYGLAQKKLGDIYSTGNAVVERDYETALKWYEKARDQGVEIPRPLVYPGDPNQVIRLR